ncbi:MAG: hypothetical protein K9J17_16465 [Flavobacteriales bacterium]|nr:hypothetical protein [Flavobacteriales bacterium]
MELELIEAALQVEYPPYEGWKQLNNCELDDDFNIDFLFVRKGEPPVAVLLMESPYIKKEDMMLVDHVKSAYRRKMNGREVHVVLAYQEMLMRPQRIPKGMSLLVVSEDIAVPMSLASN